MFQQCWIYFFWAGIAFGCLQLSQGQAQKTKTPKRYTVDLDVAPEKRWQQVALDHRQTLKDILNIFKSFIPSSLFPYIEKLFTNFNHRIKKPYAEEIRGIANALNISVGDVVMANLMYDVSIFCTSIVSQDENGQIWHSRNLDYSFADVLRNITILVDFQSGGRTVYNAVTYAGYIGILTGQRPNAFTITVNSRAQGSTIWNLIMLILEKNVVPVSFLVRDSIANDRNFSAAVQRLSYTVTAANAYFIIAGVNKGDGAVITKGRFAPDDVWKLDLAHGSWFLVETNYDHWKPTPPDDDRRTPAINAMKALGQKNISVMNLFDVMSTPKVLNEQTTYTAVMSAAKPSLMQAWIRL